MIEYENRFGDVYTFSRHKSGGFLWEGDFDKCRIGYGDNPNEIVSVNPKGGPFIKKGQMLSHIVYDTDLNFLVTGFQRISTGFLILTDLNKFDSDDFSHLKDRDIIGGII